jgi:hypothetical protein
LLILILMTACGALAGDGAVGWARGADRGARARGGGQGAAEAKRNATVRIIVSLEPPPPPVQPKARPAGAMTKPKPRRRRRRRRRVRGYSRRARPLYMRNRPSGRPTTKLRRGLVVNVIERKGDWTQVQTAGLIQVRGWVPSVVVGLRVQEPSKLYDRPGGKAIGRAAASQLVHVEKSRGKWMRVRLMGYLPVRCWMKKEDLGTKKTRYRRLKGSYPGGSSMVVSAGPLHGSAKGRVVARALDEGRVYRKRVVGRWSLIWMYDYRRVRLKAWVPTDRLRWGRYPYYGSGYSNYSCRLGRSGRYVALTDLKIYAQRDDAWPSVTIKRGARFNLRSARNGWVRVTSRSCIRLSAYAERRPGAWARAGAVRRLRKR